MYFPVNWGHDFGRVSEVKCKRNCYENVFGSEKNVFVYRYFYYKIYNNKFVSVDTIIFFIFNVISSSIKISSHFRTTHKMLAISVTLLEII